MGPPGCSKSSSGLALIQHCVLLLVGLTNGRQTDTTCAVTHNSEGWHYKIVGENKPPCYLYDWTRGTMKHVLANYKQTSKSNEVQQWNDTHLHLRDCAEDIQRNRDCPREESLQVIKCPVNCTGIFPIPSSTGRRHVLIVPVVLLFLLLLLLLACWSRCCKPKNQQTGTGPSVLGSCPCCYTPRPK